MPIRTRKKIAETPKTRSRKVYKQQKQVLPQKDRRPVKETPKDGYYYLSFLWRNTVDDFEDTVDLLRSKNLPFEWAKSPSNCMCFRILRTDVKSRPELHKPKGQKYERPCPAFMPYSCYGNENLWQMEEENGFPYLYYEWTKVLPEVTKRRRCRR